MRLAVLRLIARSSARRVGVVLVYHRVGGPGGDEDVEILPAVSSMEFARQLRDLRRKYDVVPAHDILDAVRARRRGARFPVAITFDDDLRSHVEFALPAVTAEGLPATFFLGGASLHRPNPFWWEDLQIAIDEMLVTPDALRPISEAGVQDALERSPRAILEIATEIVRLPSADRSAVADTLRAAVGSPATDSGLRVQGIRSLADAGCTIGFHTRAHHPLPSLEQPALAESFREGLGELTEAAGQSIEIVAYPHGKADDRVAAAARDAGFALGFTTARGVVRAETDPMRVPRTVADLSADALAARLARAFARRETRAEIRVADSVRQTSLGGDLGT